MINRIHLNSAWFHLSPSNNVAKEINLSMAKCTFGEMYSEICSLKLIKARVDLAEVRIPCVTIGDHICFITKYISNHTIIELQVYFAFQKA